MKRIIAFVATAYGLSIILSLVIGLTGGHESTLIVLSYLSMFLPAISVLILALAMNEPPRIRWDHFPLRYLPVALFLIPGILHAVMLPSMAAMQGGLQWQDWLTPGPDGLAVVAHGKHLAGRHRSRCSEQLGTVCVEVHEGICHT